MLPVQSAPIAMGARHAMQSDACVSVTVQGGKVCLNIPVVGSVCIPIPLPLPDGTAASACISTCGSWFPTGACVTVTALGRQVAHECFGLC